MSFLNILSSADVNMLRRRAFLRTVGGAWALSGGLTRWSSGEDRPLTSVEKRLIMRQEKPWNAEANLTDLLTAQTPLEAFFVRCHGTIPEIDTAGFRLKIEGLVERPLDVSIAELTKRFEVATSTAALTCAGNRRNEMNAIKKVPGVMWGAGAVGGTTWQGVRLADLLKSCGLKPDAKHVCFVGGDEVVDKGDKFPFGASIPLAKAMVTGGGSPLLVTQMAGRPLLKEHGYPLRLVVPGYIGARSVKWLSKIVVSDQPSSNHFVAHAYKLLQEETPAAMAAADPIYEIALNSVIGSITRGKDKVIRAAGGAIPSGHGTKITRVEVTLDGGKNWTLAVLTDKNSGMYSWTPWVVEFPARGGETELAVRAFDDSGRVQAETSDWNVKGYQFNGWHKVSVPGEV